VPTPRSAPCPCGSGKRFKDCHGAIRPSAASLVQQALDKLQARDFAGAEASLQEARRLEPDEPRIYANLGTVHVRQRRYSDAEAALARALALAPDDPYVLTLLAHLRQLRCAWDGLGALHERIRSLLEAGGGRVGSDFNPFPMLSMPTSLGQQLAVSER